MIHNFCTLSDMYNCGLFICFQTWNEIIPMMYLSLRYLHITFRLERGENVQQENHIQDLSWTLYSTNLSASGRKKLFIKADVNGQQATCLIYSNFHSYPFIPFLLASHCLPLWAWVRQLIKRTETMKKKKGNRRKTSWSVLVSVICLAKFWPEPPGWSHSLVTYSLVCQQWTIERP